MNVFVARQPIFNLANKVKAYELLFRLGLENCFPDVDGDMASAKTIVDSFLTDTIESIADGKLAFINFTRTLLLSECVYLLPRDQIVVELLEDVPPDADVIAACRELKRRGYKLALDDFVYTEAALPLVELADILKIDFRSSSEAEQERVFKIGNGHIKFLAEKVETQQDVQRAKDLGATLLQGFFYCKPTVFARKDIAPQKLNYLSVLAEINKSPFDFGRLEQVIKRDMAMSFKLLRLVNSAAFAPARRIESLRQALVMVGESNLRKWASLMALSQMAGNKPLELVRHSLTRAYFCEGLASALGLERRSADLFLTGMFSMIDAVLDLGIEEALAMLPLAPELEGALLGRRTDLTCALDICRSFEKGDWKELSSITSELNICEQTVLEEHRKALKAAKTLSENAIC